MKILFIAPSLSKLWGGTTTSIVSYFNALKMAGHKTELWSVIAEGEYGSIDCLDLACGEIRLFHSKGRWRYSTSLRKALVEGVASFDLVHIHGMWLYPHYAAANAAKNAGIPYVISPHGMLEPGALSRKALKKKLYWFFVEMHLFKRASVIHAITQSEADNVNKMAGNTKLFVLPNGVEVPDENQKLYFPSVTTVAFIGRLHPIKGLDKLLVAMTMHSGCRLIIAGDGEDDYKSYLYGLVRRFGLQEYVEFVGFADQTRKEQIYAEASFLAVVSDSEVLSLSAIEAIANGLPVLITSACNFDDIRKANAGVVIFDNKPENIYMGMSMMLEADFVKMSAYAHALAKEKYSIRNVAKRLVVEYEKIMIGIVD